MCFPLRYRLARYYCMGTLYLGGHSPDIVCPLAGTMGEIILEGGVSRAELSGDDGSAEDQLSIPGDGLRSVNRLWCNQGSSR